MPPVGFSWRRKMSGLLEQRLCIFVFEIRLPFGLFGILFEPSQDIGNGSAVIFHPFPIAKVWPVSCIGYRDWYRIFALDFQMGNETSRIFWLPFQGYFYALPGQWKSLRNFWYFRFPRYNICVHIYVDYKIKGRLKPPYSLDFKPWVFFSGETLCLVNNGFKKRSSAF